MDKDKLLIDLREAFAASGMTQREVAVKAGCHEARISNYLQGKAPLSLKAIEAIASAIGKRVYITIK